MHEGVFDPDSSAAVPMFYLGPKSGRTQALFVEPHTIETDDDNPRVDAVREFLNSRPLDPNYYSGWPDGLGVDSVSQGAVTHIALEGDFDLSDAHGLSGHEAELAVQALMASAGVTWEADFSMNGKAVDDIFGVDTSIPLPIMSQLDTRAPISIDNVVDNQVLKTPYTVEGSANIYGGVVTWSLKDQNGHRVDNGRVGDLGGLGEWTSFTVKLDELPSGSYRLQFYDGSVPGAPANIDDKRFVVE